jgi:hypothetical protein
MDSLMVFKTFGSCVDQLSIDIQVLKKNARKQILLEINIDLDTTLTHINTNIIPKCQEVLNKYDILLKHYNEIKGSTNVELQDIIFEKVVADYNQIMFLETKITKAFCFPDDTAIALIANVMDNIQMMYDADEVGPYKCIQLIKEIIERIAVINIEFDKMCCLPCNEHENATIFDNDFLIMSDSTIVSHNNDMLERVVAEETKRNEQKSLHKMITKQ